MSVPARRRINRTELIPTTDEPPRLIDLAAVGGVTHLNVLDTDHSQRVRLEVEDRARSLAGPSPAPLIQTLALTVALCEHDLRARQTVAGPTTQQEPHLRNLDRSLRRYLNACKALAAMQRAERPTVQVNHWTVTPEPAIASLPAPAPAPTSKPSKRRGTGAEAPARGSRRKKTP